MLKIRTLAAALLLAGAAVPASAAADRHRPLPAPGPNQFDIEAHRGGIGLTTENTLEAFDKALKLGVTTLELDVQITEDRVAVVTHDRRVSAQKCRDTRPVVAGDPEYPYVGKYVKDLTLAQVRTLDCSLPLADFPTQERVPGVQMPLLRQVFALVSCYRDERAWLNIETKVEAGAPHETAPREDFVQVTAREIRRWGLADRVTIQSFDWGTLMRWRQVMPRLPIVALPTAISCRSASRARRRGWVGSTSTTSAAPTCARRTPSARTLCRPCTATRRTARWAIPATCRTRRPRWCGRRTRAGWRSCRGRSTTRRRWPR